MAKKKHQPKRKPTKGSTSKKPTQRAKKVLKTPQQSVKGKKGVPLIFFTLVIVGGIIWWWFSQQSTITFILDADLPKGEPPAVKITINREEVAITDKQGKARFPYKARIGDTLDVAFTKETFTKDKYVSLSDFEIPVTEKQMFVERRIRFRFEKYVPPGYDVDLNFQSKERIPAIIFLNSDSLGILNTRGMFSYKRTFRKEDEMRLEFEVESSQFDIETVPDVITYNVNRNISGTINIYALLRKTPVISLRFINETTKELLRNIDVKFSDSEESVRTNELGLITYRIQSRRIGETIKYSLPQKFVSIKSGYKKIKLVPDMPDSLSYVLLCEARYGVQLVVIGMDGDPIPGVTVTLEDKHETTNKNGEVAFEIPRIDKLYNVRIQKDRYQDISSEIAPQGFVTSDTFRLSAIYGTLIVVDSLTTEPIPYIDIFEYSKKIGQTGSDGKATIGILLNKPLKLFLRPPPNSIYLSKETDVSFNRVGSLRQVRISPKPYVFKFSVTNDIGGNIEGVQIDYGGRTFRTDQKGEAQIELFVVVPEPEEEFEITYLNYRKNVLIDTDKEIREYFHPEVIASEATIVIKISSPVGGSIRILDEVGNEIGSGQSPFTVNVPYGTYRIIASDTKGNQAELIEDISADRDESNPIVLDLSNPVAQLINLYRKEKYENVIMLYGQKKDRILNILKTQDPYKGNRCEILKMVATSYGKVEQWDESSDVYALLEDQRCGGMDPHFYRNYATVVTRLEKWDLAAEKFREAAKYIVGIAPSDRPRFHTECLYGEGQSMLNHYEKNQKNEEFLSKEEPCDYLEDIRRVFEKFQRIAADNGIDVRKRSVDSAMRRVFEGQRQNDCGG